MYLICLCLRISGSHTSSVTRLASTRSAQMAKLGCRATNLPLPWQKMAVSSKVEDDEHVTKSYIQLSSGAPLLRFYLVGGCCGYFRLHDFHVRTVLATSVICFSCQTDQRKCASLCASFRINLITLWRNDPKTAPVPVL